MKAPGLSPKRQRFVDEYLIDLNATQAAIRAKYSAKTAEQTAARLLRNVKVAAAIQAAQAKRAERMKVDHNYVITNLLEIVERCMQRAPILDAAGAETGEWKFDARGATGAIKLLGEHLGMFNQKAPDNTNELLASLLRDAIQSRLRKRGGVDRLPGEPSEVGGAGHTASVAIAPAYSTN